MSFVTHFRPDGGVNLASGMLKGSSIELRSRYDKLGALVNVCRMLIVRKTLSRNGDQNVWNVEILEFIIHDT